MLLSGTQWNRTCIISSPWFLVTIMGMNGVLVNRRKTSFFVSINTPGRSMFIPLGQGCSCWKKPIAMEDTVNSHGAMVFAILFSTRQMLGEMRADYRKLKAGFAWRKAPRGHTFGLITLLCSQCLIIQCYSSANLRWNSSESIYMLQSHFNFISGSDQIGFRQTDNQMSKSRHRNVCKNH